MEKLEEKLKQMKDWVATTLEERYLLTSSSLLGNKQYTTPGIARTHEIVITNLGRSRLLEKNQQEIICSEEKSKYKWIIMYEAADSIARAMQRLASANLNGEEREVGLQTGTPTEQLIADYCDHYELLSSKRLMNSEQRFINQTAEYFNAIANGLRKKLPHYTCTLEQNDHHESLQLDRPGEQLITPQQSNLDLSDVVGLEEQKRILTRCLITPFKDLARHKELKEKPEKIIDIFTFIFSGPPGTGKTHLAKAIAGELGVPYYETMAADFIESTLGSGKNKLVATYEAAASHERAIVFIDEAEPICYQRGTHEAQLKGDVTTALLSYTDGIRTKGTIATIMNTNLSGQFDKAIISRVPAPNFLTFEPLGSKALGKILTYHLNLYKHEQISDAEIGKLTSRIMQGEPRMIKHLVQTASFYALEEGAKAISAAHLSNAIGDYLKT